MSVLKLKLNDFILHPPDIIFENYIFLIQQTHALLTHMQFFYQNTKKVFPENVVNHCLKCIIHIPAFYWLLLS